MKTTADALPTRTENYVDVLALSDLPAGSQKTVHICFTRVLLCHTEQGLYAIEDKCSHAVQPLAGGEIENGVITCPKHGACFDLATGNPVNNVSRRPVRTFGVRVNDGRIEIDPVALKP